MRYLCKISYDGYDFNGFQKQAGKRTIQGEIEGKLSQIFNREISIFASGRTDKQVHAYGQYFHFDIEELIDVNRLRYSLNRMLTAEIHCHFIKMVENTFHARFSAISKEYRYCILLGENCPFKRRLSYNIKENLDVELMEEAAVNFIGTHDFKCFTSKPEDEQNFIRIIDNITILKQDNNITLSISGNGFMRYMVRMIFGVLVAIGEHKEEPELVKRLLSSQNRDVTRHKLPGYGLYLVDVKYEEGGQNDSI